VTPRTTPTTDAVYWDPYDTAIDDDPYPVWRRLRDEAPVYRNDRFDFWALSRFADVEAASRDHRTFSSAHGTVLELMSPDPYPGSMIIFKDPPEHTRLRALVSKAFTPGRVRRLEDDIRRLCATWLEGCRAAGRFEFMADFAAKLPATVIATLLGVPEADRERMRHLIDQVFHLDPETGMVNPVAAAAQAEIGAALRAELEERIRRPRDDMLSDLVRAEIDDADGRRRLTLAEAFDFASILIHAGTETVARLLGNAAVTLAAHPDQRAALAADPALIPGAVEELLRYEAPSPVQGRWTTAAVRLHGTEIPAGSKVLLLTASAGRDERKYPDPDRFDIHRRFDHHVSFGFGVHFCLGAALARLESRVALEELLARIPRWEVDLAGARRMHTSTVRGWASVPVAVVP
jgi:cytochrome P450